MRPDRASHLLPFLLVLIGGLLGCGRSTTVPRAEDLLARSAPVGLPVLESRMGLNREVYCDSRTRYGIEMLDGALHSAIVLSGKNPRLTLSGCRPSSAAAAQDLPATLTLHVESNGDRSREVAVEVPVHESWWRREIDLSDLEGEVLHLRFRMQLSPGERLFLNEVTLHHEVPALKPAARRPRQVLLVSLDTLRFDAVDTDSEGRTPAFARLARQAERWSPHYAASSWTQPSHAALLTGQPPAVHAAAEQVLHPAVPTLAERFRAAGFRTAGAVFDCVWLGEKFGFDRGFGEYHVGKWPMEAAVHHTLNWIGEHRGEDFFFFLHTFEAHSDYRRLPYESRAYDVAAVAEMGFPDYGCRQGLCASRMVRGMREGKVQPLDGEGPLLRRLYQAGVEDTDRSLALLLAGLERLGVWDDLLLVVTSDHGELFLERGEVLHGGFWEAGVRVPLFVKWPQGRHAGVLRTTPSGALDLAPTLLTAFDLPAEGLPGTPLVRRREAGAGAPIVIDHGRWAAVVTAGQDRLKLVDHRSANLWWLFDLKADPGERTNLLEQRPEDAARLQAQLTRYFDRSAQVAQAATRRGPAGDRLTPELDPEERKRLRALGY